MYNFSFNSTAIEKESALVESHSHTNSSAWTAKYLQNFREIFTHLTIYSTVIKQDFAQECGADIHINPYNATT